MRGIAVFVLAFGLGGTALTGFGKTASFRTSATAKLQLVATHPLTLAGTGFRSRERVRVTASTGADRIRATLVTATRLGGFRVELELNADRCDLIRVVAVGRAGTRAVLKRLPPPACMPEKSPE
jgi:hypothetical protein